MINRVREIFKDSGLSQSEIARKLDVTPQYIYKLMNLDIEPSERIILAIEKAFPNINYIWLRKGEGEMYKPRTRETEIAEMTKAMFDADESDFKYQLMKLLTEMTPEQIHTFREVAEKFQKNLKEAQEKADTTTK